MLYILTVLLLLGIPDRGQATSHRYERLFYLVDNESSIQAFLEHAEAIDIVAPQTYYVDSDGIVWGTVDPRVMERAREAGVKVVPLIVNPGFDQSLMHELLADEALQDDVIAQLIAYAKEQGFAGWQFDFEHIHVRDRDRYTDFCRKASDAFRQAGLQFSIAVVPRPEALPGPTAYHRWVYANWRGGYDLKALARVADFLSIMTYDQHSRATPPGPIAGIPWMEWILAYMIDELGIPPAKLSLGIPLYSGYWHPTYQEKAGPRATRSGITYARAKGLLDAYHVEPSWDAREGVYWAKWSYGGVHVYIFLEEARSFQAKQELMVRYGLRGFSAWRIGQEDPAIWSMLKQ